MKVLEKWSFVLAPVCLFAAFFSSAVLQSQLLMSVLIALATVFLILAVALGKCAGSALYFLAGIG